VGLGWGDEGKGKIIDLLGPHYRYVVRYNGGANAGHTVWVRGEKFALHLVPMGILHPHATAVIGPGVAVDPLLLVEEIEHLRGRGVEVGSNLRISDRAHVVAAYHKIEDQLSESGASEEQRIGTTARGIGPCYADKMRRHAAIRMCDLYDERRLSDRLRGIVAARKAALAAAYGGDGGLEYERTRDELLRAAERLRTHVCDAGAVLREGMAAGGKALFEGANGIMLDVDHGTYPFVTSSSTGPHGAAGGAGVPPTAVTSVLGVTKAYSTRVGSGPFVSELKDATGDRIRESGREYGTTTGRPRRVGWLDAVALRYAAGLGGLTEAAVMHLDTLSGFEQVGVCVAYDMGGRRWETVPADCRLLESAAPVLEFCPGWSGDLRGVRRFEGLPQAAQAYVRRIEAVLGCPVGIIGVGPARDEVVCRGVRASMTAPG
jgi:adenylosuccinate synthase